jgi:hypothetical protein
MAEGLGKRLADFITAWMEPLEPPHRSAAPMPEKGRLALQLLRTLRPQALIDGGYGKRAVEPPPGPRGPDPQRFPQPRPVGDLARPRAD